MTYPTQILSEVFRDTSGHVESSEIIIAHSTNKKDIREIALEHLDLSDAKNVMDIGCGFGFFTEALQGRIHPDARVTGIDSFAEYRQPYLNICRKSGFKGAFSESGVALLSSLHPASADLVLSSFSMYFFPEALPVVASILKSTGKLIIITHYSSHLCELTAMVNEIVTDLGFPQSEPPPHDRLIANFTAEDGLTRLSPYFEKIEKRDYMNELVFDPPSATELIRYIAYKRSFFIPENILKDPLITKQVENEIFRRVSQRTEFIITKNDAIFICTHNN